MKPWLKQLQLVGFGIAIGVGLTLGVMAVMPKPAAPTPTLPDPLSQPLTIRIAEAGCYDGVCPIYDMTASADPGEKTGTVTFNGQGFTCTRGRVSRSIGRESLDALAARLEERGFFGLNEAYTEVGWTDDTTIIVSVSAHGHNQTITHYRGAANAPNQLLADMEADVGSVLNVGNWIYGCPDNERQKFDPYATSITPTP